MHPLDDVPAVVEHPPNVLRVHRAREVGIAVVSTVLPGVSLIGLLRQLEEVVPDEVLCARELPVLPAVQLRLSLGRDHVDLKVGEVIFQFGLSRLDLVLEEVLLVEKKDHRNGSEPAVVPNRSEIEN